MKVRPHKLTREAKIKYLDALYTASSVLKTKDDMKKFLRDLLTESERIMIGRRIIIAHKLLQDEGYDQISSELKAGKDTITKVHQWLQDEVRGYEKAIEKFQKILDQREEKKVKANQYHNSPFKQLKKRYPLHFLLFNLFDKPNER